MKHRVVEFAGQSVTLEFCDDRIGNLLGYLFSDISSNKSNRAGQTLRIEVDKDWQNCVLLRNGEISTQVHSRGELGVQLFSDILFSLIDRCDTGHVLHAAAVHKGSNGILIPGKSGAGKTTLCAWLVAHGYSYLTDEAVYFPIGESQFESFTRPFNFKSGSIDALNSLVDLNANENEIESTDDVTLLSHRIFNKKWSVAEPTASLILFPEFIANSEFSIEPLSSAQTSMALMAVYANARNLKHHGFHEITHIARSVPAFRLIYSNFDQLEDQLDLFLGLVFDKDIDTDKLTKLFRSVNNQGIGGDKPKPEVSTTLKVNEIPVESRAGGKKKLTIGMATYDDYDGVYFSVQALRMYHPEVTDKTEILIIDNNPTGSSASALKKLDSWVPGYRYIPNTDIQGTAIRDFVFEQANADYVLCIDSHVLLQPGSICKFIDYMDVHPECMDLLQGPMLYDDQSKVMTHFEPQWRGGMFGTWAIDERGVDENNQPFEIPMQGLGLFGCRKEAWLGFNKNFRGFGGEEGYIHEKFRQAGHRTLCLPFLRWLHRFERPNGVPYRLKWEDRIHNYLVGFNELNMDTAPVIDHFRDHLGKQVTDNIVADVYINS